MTNRPSGGSTEEPKTEKQEVKHNALFDDLCWELLEKIRADFVIGRSEEE